MALFFSLTHLYFCLSNLSTNVCEYVDNLMLKNHVSHWLKHRHFLKRENFAHKLLVYNFILRERIKFLHLPYRNWYN